MSLAVIDPLVGRALVAVREFLWSTGECEGAPWLVAVAFVFDAGTLVLSAHADDDSIVAEAVATPEAWTGGSWDMRELSSRDARSELSNLVGNRLVNVWGCSTCATHIDAIDLGFGDLVLPSIKLLVAASQLRLLTLSEISAARSEDPC